MALGQILRESREHQGYSVSQVAEATRMMVQIVEDLEREDFRRIAAPIYGRGFVKFYAEFLKIDAEPLVKEFNEIYSGARRPVVATRALKHAAPSLSTSAKTASVPAADAPASIPPPRAALISQAAAIPAKPLAAPAHPNEPVRAAPMPTLADDAAEAPVDVRPAFHLEAEPTTREATPRPEHAANDAFHDDTFGRWRKTAAADPSSETADPFAAFDEEERPSLAAKLGERCQAASEAAARGWSLLKRRLRRRRPSGAPPRPSRVPLLLGIAATALLIAVAAAVIVRSARRTPAPAQPVLQEAAVPLTIAPILPPPEPYVD